VCCDKAGRYDAHVAVVKPETPQNTQELSYVPCGPEDAGDNYLTEGRDRVFMEIVVFELAQVLPWAVVEIQQ